VKNTAYYLILFLLCGCVSKYEKPPENLIQESEMRSILVDLYTEEAIIQQQNLQGDSALEAYILAKNEVLKRHKADTALFRKSQDFYNNHTDTYTKMYEGIVDTLALREQRGLVKK